MANGDDKDVPKRPDTTAPAAPSLVPQGWTLRDLPDGTKGYAPPEHTDDEVKRQHLSTMDLSPKGLEDQMQGPIGKGWDWLWNSRVSPDEAAKFWSYTFGGGGGEPKTKAGKVIGGALSDVTSAMTSPGQIALTLGSLGEWKLDEAGGEAALKMGKWLVPLLKRTGRTADAYYGLQGLGALLGQQQEGESDSDAIERRMLGAMAFLGAAHMGVKAGKDMISDMLVRGFGIDESLAEKVTSRMEQLEAARGTRDTSLASIERQRTAETRGHDLDTNKRIADVESKFDRITGGVKDAAFGQKQSLYALSQEAQDASRGRVNDLHREQLHTGAQMMSDAVQAIRELEGDPANAPAPRLEGSIHTPFREIGEDIKGPVSSEGEVRGIIDANFKKLGINPEEMPRGATAAIGRGEPGEVYIDTHGGVKRLDLGEGGEQTFTDLTRIREDLWQTSEGAKDTKVAKALKDSYNQVTSLQEKVADEHGQGDKYRKAKYDYLVFKRGLGGSDMQKWLSAQDAGDQAMGAKVSQLIANDDKLTNGATTETLRTLLKAAGVDTKPLDDITARIKYEKDIPTRLRPEFRAKLEQINRDRAAALMDVKGAKGEVLTEQKYLSAKDKKEINAKYDALAKQAKEEYEAKERDVERNPIIPRYGTEELVGKDDAELYRLKISQMAQGGQLPVTSIVMTAYGILHMSAFPFLYGIGRGGIPTLVKSPKFQSWLIERAGIREGTREANVMRRAIANMGPALSRLEKAGIPPVGAAAKAKREQATSINVTDQPPSREDVISVQP